uniref:Translocase of outer mitochondrial membrane 40 like n=1 Tax=Sphaeramia orbicularis TaxID=375764 RepID=A0A672ZIA8_9TELE
MGSVLALSSNPGHQHWPFSTDPSPSRWDRRDGRLPNPGSFHSLHRSCKDVFPQQIEGVKMIINKTLSSFFKVSHTLHLSAVSPSYYRFHVEHLQSDDYSKDKDAPALIGEMDSSGSLNAHALLHLTERVRARTVFQTQQSQFVTWQFETEYRGNDFTAAVTVANPDILRESVILVAHFLQSVSSGLVLGGELVYHRGRAEEGGILTLAGQYSRPNWVATLNAGKGGAHANTRLLYCTYVIYCFCKIQMGICLCWLTRFKNFQPFVKRLTPLPATLIMGAFVNHKGDKLQVGLGVTVG